MTDPPYGYYKAPANGEEYPIWLVVHDRVSLHDDPGMAKYLGAQNATLGYYQHIDFGDMMGVQSCYVAYGGVSSKVAP